MEIPTSLCELIQPYTKSTPQRMASMYEALMKVSSSYISGDIVECGVWRGGNIMLARIVCPERDCWLYDTFNGMTEPDHELDRKRPNSRGVLGELAIDRYRAKQAGGTKWDAVDIDTVKHSFKTMGLDDRCIFMKGAIEETIHLDQPDQISILRLDMDWYIPTKVALDHLYPKLVRGGFLIVDDYGHWMGCKKAVDDYFESLGYLPEMTFSDYSCVTIRKP